MEADLRHEGKEDGVGNTVVWKEFGRGTQCDSLSPKQLREAVAYVVTPAKALLRQDSELVLLEQSLGLS